MMRPEDVARLDDSALRDLADAVSREQRKRGQRVALSGDVVAVEVDRIRAVKAAQQEAADEAWKVRIISGLKRRIREFENGSLELCFCRNCAEGYVLLDLDRLCLTGQRQFWTEVDRSVRV